MGEKGDPWRSYVFYKDHVMVTFPNETTDECYYRDFTKIHHGDKIILVYTAGKRNLLFDKSRFIGEMPDFLKEENAKDFPEFVEQFVLPEPTPIYRDEEEPEVLPDNEMEPISEETAESTIEALPDSSDEDNEE